MLATHPIYYRWASGNDDGLPAQLPALHGLDHPDDTVEADPAIDRGADRPFCDEAPELGAASGGRLPEEPLEVTCGERCV